MHPRNRTDRREIRTWTEFERGDDRPAARAVSARKGCMGMELQPLGRAAGALPLVRQSGRRSENHTGSIVRGSADFQEWRKLVGHCFACGAGGRARPRDRAERLLTPCRPWSAAALSSPPLAGPYWRDGEIPRQAERDPAKHSKKDPAKPTRAKASRPELAPIEPALARTAQSRHRPGHRRAGLADRPAAAARQFVRPPRGFLRRAPRAQIDAEGFEEAPQSGYAAKGGRRRRRAPIAKLAQALGFEGDDEAADAKTATRTASAASAAVTGVTGHRAGAGDRCCARAGRNSASGRGRRTARRGRRNPRAASASSSSPTSSPRATSRRRSASWSRASAATTAPRCCSASPARARPSPWRR